MTDAQLEMVLTNVGDESIRPVVISIFGGDPTNPPIVDGIVDLSQSGVSDANSSLAAFGLEYPDVEALFTQGDSRVTGEVPLLDPGDSIAISVFGSGPFVIFDYRQGEFQAGSFVVIEQ